MQKVCYETGKAAQTEYEVLEYAEDNTARVRLKPIRAIASASGVA
jgi:tRNA pseudouridine32 synthase/23S rRNA pseudouridine746 synthase